MSEQIPFSFGGVTKPPRVVIFDIETMLSAHEVGGWENLSKMRMAVGVCYDTLEDQYFIYEEADVTKLIDHLARADLVVGFNHIRFDCAVLGGYADKRVTQLINFDILVDITQRLGHRLKLDSLAKATLGVSKSADGMQSLMWVKEGKMDLVREYCKRDVEVTRQLFEYGVKNGFVYYYDRDLQKVQLRVDWNVSDLIGLAKKPNPRAT